MGINLFSKLFSKMVALLFISTLSMSAGAMNLDKSLVKDVKKISKTISNSININTASVDDLKKLKGIGAKKAKAIVDYRKKNGNFKDLKGLLKVKGFGKKTLSNTKSLLSL